MTVKKSVLLFLALLAFIIGFIAIDRGGRAIGYTDAELVEMSAGDLYKVLLANGLQADEDLTKVLSEEQLAEYIKTDFHLLKDGVTSRSHTGYMKLADDIKKIYENIVKK